MPDALIPFAVGGIIVTAGAFLIPDRIFLPVFFLTLLLWNIPVGSGIWSRFYVGNFIFAIAVCRWASGRIKSRTTLPHINLPLTLLCALAIVSLAASVLASDPTITYQYPNTYVQRELIVFAELALILSVWFAPRVSAGFSRVAGGDAAWLALYIGATVSVIPVIVSSILGTGQQSILGHLRPATTQYWYGVAILPFIINDLYRYRGRRLLLTPMVILIGAAAYLSFSRQIWIWVTLAVAVPVVLRSWRHRILTLTTICCALALLAFAGGAQFFNPEQVYGLERTNYYIEALSLFARHPLLGVGSGNYQFFSLADAGAMQGGIAHNQVLTVLAEFGILVVPVLAGLVVALIAMVRSVAPALRPAAYGFILAWFSSWFATEMAFPSAAAGGGAGVSLYVVFMWLIVGLLCAAAREPFRL